MQEFDIFHIKNTQSVHKTNLYTGRADAQQVVSLHRLILLVRLLLLSTQWQIQDFSKGGSGVYLET